MRADHGDNGPPRPTRLGTQELMSQTQVALDMVGEPVKDAAPPQLYHDEKVDHRKERKDECVRCIHESIEPRPGPLGTVQYGPQYAPPVT
jgi:hypothetical protein